MTRFTRWSLALTLPAVLVTFVFYLVPIGQVLALSVLEPEPGLGNYAAMLESRAVARVFRTTAEVSLMTSAITVLAAYIIAFALLGMRPALRRIALFLVLVPFWISVLVRAFSWITLLRREGVVNSALAGLGLIEAPLELVHNRLGVVIGMVHYMMPFAVLLMYANLSGIDRRVADAARSLGARPAQVFWRIWLPLSRPAIAVAGVFVLIFSLGFLVTPALLGAGKTVMIAEYISVQITSSLRWGMATALSTVLLAAVAVALLIILRSPAMRQAFGGRAA